MRSPLVVSSIGIHVAVVAGFFVAGVWQLDRLEAAQRPFDLAVAPEPPPPAASGSPAAAKAEPFKKKPQKVITKDIVVPEDKPTEDRPETSAQTPGDGSGGTGSGAGSGSGTDPTGTGTCTTPPCGTSKTPPPQTAAPQPIVVPPTVIKGLRTSGETQIHPPDPVKTAMMRDGKKQMTATMQVCVGVSGEVEGVKFLKSSGYAAYDTALDEGLRRWRYRAYEVNGKKVPVCGVVTFIYAIK